VTTLDPRTLVAYANEIARAFGVDATVIAEPRNERQRIALLADLRGRLEDVRPVASAASIGEVLAALLACAREGGPTRRARKQLAELDDLVAAGTYARTKRAERGRIFALLLVVFDLVPLVGVEIDAADPEKALKLVRRARR
jgi:hypothetical protein